MLQGIPEELVFRGYLMQLLRRHPSLACWVSATLFELIHLISNGGQQNVVDHVLYLAIPFGFGFLAAALVVRFRWVWAAVGIHAGFHVAGIPLQFLGLDAEGRHFWIAAGLVYLLAGLVILRNHGRTEVVIDR